MDTEAEGTTPAADVEMKEVKSQTAPAEAKYRPRPPEEPEPTKEPEVQASNKIHGIGGWRPLYRGSAAGGFRDEAASASAASAWLDDGSWSESRWHEDTSQGWSGSWWQEDNRSQQTACAGAHSWSVHKGWEQPAQGSGAQGSGGGGGAQWLDPTVTRPAEPAEVPSQDPHVTRPAEPEDPHVTRPAEPEVRSPSQVPPPPVPETSTGVVVPPLTGRPGQQGRYVQGGFVTADGVFHEYLWLCIQSGF